jgi:ribosomal protein S18 acetylase RimI-like enzyme
MPAIGVRQANLDDAADILALLLQLAPEIPLLADTLEREEALYALVRNCARSGESWVAVDEADAIVGFVLAEPNRFARHYAEHEVIELHYAGVAAEHRDRGVFGQLIGHVLARLQPVTMTVAHDNRSGMAARLERLGFRPAGNAGGERRWRREPGQP